jgi:predicted  nucleic acid-binding Zn-ribbon protein
MKIRRFILSAIILGLSGCSTMYYGTMEKLGVHKRDIMVDRVKAARDTQNEAKQQFLTAMEQFKRVVNFQSGDLEKEYNKLNATLRKSSQQKYDATKKKYTELIKAMKRAEAKLEPALAPLRDQVLFMKHNLNARAIAGLSEELISVQTNVDKLVRDMESAIAQADAFIASLQAE